ncbi:MULTISPECIES: substrate-binding domain-containing protein [Pseudomonas]|jgi:phosphate transport system substrate-binding protein|uniref:Membrane protein n=1 Tax=Pseudomonas frederiksbergensis TaxID=104087 RepID=A0A0B1Z1P3_9PSED|nr:MULTISPECIES: phosphate ABC transporter substrate-binding/OmpA family protein [Pseudomonas]KHK63198.1 membrane protein [Pseudomonas frederiksbergensis]KJH86747.1 membrane protein [Pseudomonas fluorescens]MBI6620315.1 phosphate ABC transporter substrate-binding/OmpA family protein [Pseudomonas corrugata]MBI6695015.1 phosphate ABC transporter substrate-binding/OmpA family protein [Pseudomonas corrugata]WRV70221.1 phosphate ABC transporter substrate-binding/OmpA family protein [Pseudomonas fre
MRLCVVFFLGLWLPCVAWSSRLPIPDHGPALRLQGSNTIGAALAPALVRGLMEDQGLLKVSTEITGRDNEQRIVGQTADGQRVTIDIAAHGSSTGFIALKQANADLAASSRPIKDSELKELAALGDLKSPASEQVIAIDGLAIILHPQNPLRQLDTVQLARIFSGEAKTWESVGGVGGPIHLYARDEQSGTYDTFKELVLNRQGKKLDPTARRFESSEQLSDAVSQDPQGIGFIGLPYVRQAKPLAIVDGASQPMLPLNNLIATEDYPLSRRLFFYLPTLQANPWAEALVDFTQGEQGQAIVAANGFIAQTVQAMAVVPNALMPEGYQALSRHAQRLTVNFRFEEGSASLDSKAQQDLGRVLDYIKQHGKADRRVTLVGFGDLKDDPARADLLSRLRAMAVRRELVKYGVTLREVRGFGALMPVAANSEDEGRVRNRRVEVWVY